MKVYLVGGAVRDGLLGLPVYDKDFVVVGLDSDEMKQLGFAQVGVDFPVFLHPNTHFEYALARVERKNGEGHQGFITQTKGVTLADDLLRRDLTINALAIEVGGLFDETPTTGQVIDFYGGIQDLRNKTLRHISEAFGEDPLRILRTVRFLARFYELGFKIASETIQLMQTMAKNGELSHLSRERLWTESVKAMENGTAHYYWQHLKELEILAYFLTQLDECWQNQMTFYTVINQLKLAKHENIAVQFAVLCGGYLGDEKSQNTLIKTTAHALNAPKYPIHIAQLLSEFYQIFNDKPKADDIIKLLGKTKAHQGNTQALDDVLTAIFITNKDTAISKLSADMLLKNCITVYKSIGIDDINKNLKGREIGLALTAVREQKIDKLLQKLQ